MCDDQTDNIDELARGDSPDDSDTLLIKSNIKECCKSLSDTVAQEIASKLVADGLVKEFRHLASEDDLIASGLNKFQAKAVINSWSRLEERTNLGTQDQPSTSHQPTVLMQSNSTLVEIGGFTLDWESIYSLSHNTESARKVLQEKKRPSPKLRLLIVKEVVRQVMLKVAGVTRATFNPVFNNMIMLRHPESFREVLGHGTECAGGFLFQLKTRFDNQKRPERNTHLRNPDVSNKMYECPKGKFSYGCVRWRVRDLDKGQTDETVEEQKKRLQKLYKEVRPKFWDWKEIEKIMTNTYKSQRDMLNKNNEDAMEQQKKNLTRKRKRNEAEQEEVDDPSEAPAPLTIADIGSEWPFLFTYQGMHIHYNILTQVNLQTEMEKFVKDGQLDALIEFFSKENDEFYSEILKNMKKAEKKNKRDSIQLRALCLMLPKYFNEEPFIKIVEETISIESLDKTAPAYPALAVAAKNNSIFKGKNIFLGVDSTFHYSFTSFERALSCVYMMYYVFNLDYDPKCQVTMEFIQRYMFHVDPPSGNKRPTKSKARNAARTFSTKIVHPDVARLFRKVQRLEKQKDVDEAESEESNEVSEVEVF